MDSTKLAVNSPDSAVSVAERRREPRHSASGALLLEAVAPPHTRFAAELVDTSVNGFRAAHSNLLLQTGDVVDVIAGFPKSRARAMWTRIVGSRVETGFLLLTRDIARC